MKRINSTMTLQRKRGLMLPALAFALAIPAVAEVDVTEWVGNAQADWVGASGFYNGSSPTMPERYNAQFWTGSVMGQRLKHLPNGTYQVEIYCNASCTGRSWESQPTASNGATDCTILTVNNQKVGIPIGNNVTAVAQPNLYTLSDVKVTNGEMCISLDNVKQGANWFIASIKSLKYMDADNLDAYASILPSTFVVKGTTYLPVGENLIKNGSFNSPLTKSQWTAADGGALQSSNFSTEGNCLEALSTGGGSSAQAVRTLWKVEKNKKYVFSYRQRMKHSANVNTQYVVTSLTNTAGTESKLLLGNGQNGTAENGNSKMTSDGSWTTNTIVFDNTEYNYLQFAARWLDGNYCFDDFQLVEVKQQVNSAPYELARAQALAYYGQDGMPSDICQKLKNAIETVPTDGDQASYDAQTTALTTLNQEAEAAYQEFVASGATVAAMPSISGEALSQSQAEQVFRTLTANGIGALNMADAAFADGVTEVTNAAAAANLIVENPAVTVKNAIVAENGALQQGSTLTDRLPFQSMKSFTGKVVYRRPMPATSDYGTLVLPFKVSSNSQTQLYQPQTLTDDVLVLAEQESVEANTPCIFYTQADELVVEGDGLQASVEKMENDWLAGCYQQLSQVPMGAYVISKDKFYQVDSEVTLAPFRAYFTAMPGASSEAKVLSLWTDLTGVEQALATKPLIVVVAKGSLTLKANQQTDYTVHNVGGALLQQGVLKEGEQVTLHLVPGTYIVNNQKVMIQ